MNIRCNLKVLAFDLKLPGLWFDMYIDYFLLLRNYNLLQIIHFINNQLLSS